MTNITDSLRYAEDFTNAVDCLLSQNQKAMYVVYVTGDQIAFDDPPNEQVKIVKRITIADGYRPWTQSLISPYDGYLYPRIDELKDKILVESGGQLGNMKVLIGSLVFPYCFNGISGGYDPLKVFQPKRLGNRNVQVYLRIFGLGLPTSSNYFTIRQIMLSGKDIQEGISYKIVAEANGLNLGE